MKVLFVTSEHPSCLYGGLGTFTREYVKELKKSAEVKCVYFHLRAEPSPEPDETVDYVFSPFGTFEAFSPEAQILESASSLRAQVDPIITEFKPDIIHCNDRQTYLPFRFDDNVFYSSHLIYTDLISSSALNDFYFQEIKVERCALENCAVLGVYSDFAASSAYKLAGGHCSPVVLPLGLKTDSFIKKSSLKTTQKRLGQNNDNRLTISYFGRFENVQKGINDFIYAVNLLGLDFKNKHNLTYNLYGRGEPDSYMDISLFDNITFLEGQDLIDAYQKSDIVVMPSRYEPFGFTGLEAMASGALLLVTEGLGMDMYAEPGVNCLSIPHDPYGISVVLRQAILDYDKLNLIKENAVRTARQWTWERCINAHIDIYREIIKNRISQISSAYRYETREIIKSYKKASDVEKLYCSNMEQKAIDRILKKYEYWNSDEKILVLTGAFKNDINFYGQNIIFASSLNENSNGMITRLECLPYKNKEFDLVIVCGAWETVIDPCGALSEIERITKNNVIVLYNKGKPHQWQTIQMEDESDWINLNRKNWKCFPKTKNRLLEALNLEESTPYAAVIYNHLYEKSPSKELITA